MTYSEYTVTQHMQLSERSTRVDRPLPLCTVLDVDSTGSRTDLIFCEAWPSLDFRTCPNNKQTQGGLHTERVFLSAQISLVVMTAPRSSSPYHQSIDLPSGGLQGIV